MKSIFLVILLSFSCSGYSCSFVQNPELSNIATNYYIDNENGNDINDGLSVKNGWKSLLKVNKQTFHPGDSILFKAGGSWSGQLLAKGSGNVGNPIVVSSYGKGKKPLIDGRGTVNYVILLEDVDYWHIKNLEITNQSSQEGDRIGVFLKSNSGQRNHFRFSNLFIHDISGRYTFEMQGKNTGGIGIIGYNDSRFDDIIIEECEIANIIRVGIFTNGNTGLRGNRPITNLIVRNNIIHHCAGDGVIIRYSKGAIIERNTAYENHCADEKLVKYGVALWCRSADETIFQYNEVFNTRGKMDGQAFDADLDAWRTVIQYNYSHDNEGGFMLVYGTSSEAIVRFNISVNDGTKRPHIFHFSNASNPRGFGFFHNNLIFIPKDNNSVIVDGALPTSIFYNNIFYKLGGGNLVVFSNKQTAIFRNNCLFNYLEKDTWLDLNGITNDPLFIDVQAAALGFKSTEGFKISAKSPFINAGINNSSIEGYWLPDFGGLDFWGDTISAENNIGVQ